MNKCVALLALAALVPLSSCGKGSKTGSDGAPREPAAARPEAIRSDLEFLADDLLEGRATGSRGFQLAARFVSARFAALGLEPVGDAGGYLQEVPLRRIEPLPEASAVTLVRETADGVEARQLVSGRDFALRPHPSETRYVADAPLVFVGYGISAPDLGHDDYGALDVTGKAVVVLGDAPPGFPPAGRAQFSTTESKADAAAQRGAVALLRLTTPADERRFSWRSLARYLRSPDFRWLDPEGHLDGETSSQSIGVGFLSPDASALLFEGTPLSWSALLDRSAEDEVAAVELPLTLQMVNASRHDDVSSHNVAGLLPGSDPELADEIVVFSAHLDHEGVGESEESGDAIYNGAVDNASGVASLLELARMFVDRASQDGHSAPRRSVLFLAVTAEEVGLLGSDYFARYPSVGRDRLVADINLDGTAAFYPLGDVIALGNESSSLAAATSQAARITGLEVTPDPEPEQNYFARSDQYSFVRVGVPSVYIYPGYRSTDPSVDGARIMANWMSEIYHSPADDASQPIDYPATAHFTDFAYHLGRQVADADGTPCWDPDDELGARFATEATTCQIP